MSPSSKSALRTTLFISIVVLTFCSCSEEKTEPTHPIAGKWQRNFYQYKNMPVTHKNYENKLVPSPYMLTTVGIYGERSYDLTLNTDHTFKRMMIYSNVSATSETGTWKVQDNQLVIDPDTSTKNEVYTLHSNSGTTMGFYQVQTRRLLPDAVWDTLSFEYWQEHTTLLQLKYGENVEFKMYYFFDRAE